MDELSLLVALIIAMIIIKAGPLLLRCLWPTHHEGFGPVSVSFKGHEPFFRPEGNTDTGIYRGIKFMPALKKRIDMGGKSLAQLRKEYPLDNDLHLITGLN